LAKILRYSVFILPILFIWAGLNMHKVKYANDPEYIYLVNATAICDGKSVGHIDNPGTTVMQIGAAAIAVKHLFSNPENDTIVKHVFKEPNQFVDAIRLVILILNTLVLFFLGWIAIKKTGSVWVALLLQTSTFITANTLDHVWTKMSPEPVLFFVTSLYVIAILYFYAEKEKNSWKYVIIFALLTGAGLGTKATFLPLVIFPFVIFPTFKKKFIYLAGVIPSFVLFTIPAIPEYENMYWWFRGLISHSGKYGHGEKELINLETYLPNIFKILQNNPVFGIVLTLGILLILGSLIKKISNRNENKRNWDTRILTGLVATSAFGILLVAKQYNANHYLIPVLLLTGISLFFILKILFSPNFLTFFRKAVFPIVVIGLVVLLSWQQPAKMKYANNGYKITNEEMDSTNLMLERNYSDYAKIHYYPFSLNKYSALNFGDVYTKRKMLPELKKMYPKTYFYDFYFNLMQYWNAEIFLEDVIEFNGNKILMVGGPRDENLLGELENRGLPFKKVYKGRIQAIYELDTLKYRKLSKHKFIEDKEVCDLEILTEDNQILLGSNGKAFGNSYIRSNEAARSGKHSVKMDEKTEFALEYVLDSLNKGETYEVEVWRKADNYSGRLVVGATKAGIFYKAQNDYITSDDKGWDLIRIKFTVTAEMQNETLKVYLWNKDKKLTYFDDLTIKKVLYDNFKTEIVTSTE
jgi:hypothetical protein